MKEMLVVDLGLVEYGAAWELQRRVAAARKAGAIPDVLLLCEHPHVITLGRSGKISNLRAPNTMLRQMGVSFFETDRGGDITYHGPGQLVGYPILNLAEIRRDVGLVRTQPRGSHDSRHSRVRHYRGAYPGARACGWTCRLAPWGTEVVECRGRKGIKGRRKARRHRRAFEPVGHFARICLQRVDGSALFRFDRAVRDRRASGPRRLKNCWAGRGDAGSRAADRRSLGRNTRVGFACGRPRCTLDELLQPFEERPALATA
jgi:hypothetical protein